MIAILHKNNVVGLFINNVLSVDGDSIQSVNGGARGVLHDVLIVDGYTYHEDDVPFIQKGTEVIHIGDTITPASFTDTRAQLKETDKQKIVRLEAEKAALHEQVAEINSNFMAFTDFYFEKNPDQA